MAAAGLVEPVQENPLYMTGSLVQLAPVQGVAVPEQHSSDQGRAAFVAEASLSQVQKKVTHEVALLELVQTGRPSPESRRKDSEVAGSEASEDEGHEASVCAEHKEPLVEGSHHAPSLHTL